MRSFGLIGYPLSHSFSPAYFSGKFSKEGIDDCVYTSFPLKEIEDLPALLMNNPDLEGLNVTIPYKKKVIAYLHNSTDAVGKMNACNCIKITNGQLTGYNTDVTGFEKSLLPHLKGSHKKALILGTGGAAAAVEYVLGKLNIDFLFVSRKKSSEAKYIEYADVTRQVMQEYTLIINTTPLGMYPETDNCPDIPYEYITGGHYLFDLVYNPVQTLFLKKGLEKNAVTKNGSDMLIIQAEESWKIWNSR